LKLAGYIRSDYDLLEDIHSGGFGPRDKSPVYSINRNKDGAFSKKAKVLTQEELNKLLAFVDEKIVATAEKIVSGHIALHPLEDDRYIPSMNEPYRSVSMFDAIDCTNKYRPYQSITDQDLYKEIDDKEQIYY